MDSPTESPFSPLAKRPQAITVSVKDLIGRVAAGEVRVPVFQRPLRWKNKEVLELFDSLWRGYPVGSLLFWKREAKAERINLGGGYIDAPAVPDAWWLVDGQQRTTALAAGLLDLDHQKDRRWSCFFNPLSRSFSSAPKDESAVPLSVLGDLRRFGRWLRERDLEENVVDVLEDAQARILEYSLPAYVVETEDEQALRGVFARLNSAGARMRADEVFHALHGGETEGQTTLDLSALVDACDRNGFGLPRRSEVLKCILAMSGIDPTRRPEGLSPEERAHYPSMEAAEAALLLTTDFLQNDCGIPHERLLPYPVVLVLLARWFHIHGDSGPAERIRLAQWVWRGVHSATHERAKVSKLREQVRMIEGTEAESLDRLTAAVERQPPQTWQPTKFHAKNAASRTETLALLALNPSDAQGEIDVKAILRGGHRLARGIFTSSERGESQLGATAANRVILDSVSEGLRPTIAKWTSQDNRSVLQSHLVSEEALEALKEYESGADSAAMEQFLKIRTGQINKLVDAYLTQKCDWGGSVVRPYQDYLGNAASATGVAREK